MGPELLIHQISYLSLKTFSLQQAPPAERWLLQKCSRVEKKWGGKDHLKKDGDLGGEG